MSKPDDIPQDVWDASEDHLRAHIHLLSSTEIVARAILAERERCVVVAARFPNTKERPSFPAISNWVSEGIAAVIRKGGE